MTVEQIPLPDSALLRDLLSGLAAGGGHAPLSLGIVGCQRAPAQLPAHCLQVCLGKDPATISERGCVFLTAACRPGFDPTQLSAQTCPRGFAVAVERTTVGEETALIVTVEGPLPAPTPAVAEPPNVLAHVDRAAQLVQQIGQLVAENAGFANEVIQNYEQLNLIFDLTQQISHVTELRDTEALLLRRVARLLVAEAAWIVGTDGQCRAYPETNRPNAAAAPLGAYAAAVGAIDLVRRTRHVQVSWAGPRRIVAGPLLRLDGQVEVVVAARAPGAPTFSAGDMMLLESVLAFGGQIISNTELHERMRRMSLEVTRALVAAIDKKDHYTSGHSERGGFLTRLTAEELGVSPAETQTMEWAGLLHDVGKIGIPEEILCKPGKLTPEEFDVIKQHPRMGAEILQPIASLRVVLDGVLYHHEVPNGTGYPEGLCSDQIPLVARIIHVVDTFDALTSTRSYRKSFSISKALEIIQSEKGTRIDAAVADAFWRAFDRYRLDKPADYAARFPHLLGRETDDVQP